MIQLQAVPKPPELTDKLIQDLTKKYKEDGSVVW